VKRRIELIAAPPSIQPGGYVRRAYADHTRALTPWADVSVESYGDGWHVFVAWPCPASVIETKHDVDLFADAAAILAPSSPDAPMLTMGSEAAGVDGWLWRADREHGMRVSAHGLGSVERFEAPAGTAMTAAWSEQRWGVRFELAAWDSLSKQKQIGIAVWRGAAAERGGLKSVSPNWISIR
jgi:DMSO reductase family type II enzyme heme b subunit